MTVPVNGIAHIQLTVNTPQLCIPFWEKLCHFLEMETLVKNADTVYCIGSRTGIMVVGVPEGKDKRSFDQYSVGLHHLCFRARSEQDVDDIYQFVIEELKKNHGKELLFHQSGGCCDGSAPMCYPVKEYQVGQDDVMIGKIGGIPFYISETQHEAWKNTDLIIDCVKGMGGMFSLDNGTGRRFLTRSEICIPDDVTVN